jgi:hypothetical protein
VPRAGSALPPDDPEPAAPPLAETPDWAQRPPIRSGVATIP